MVDTVHLLKGAAGDLAVATMRRQVEGGKRVVVVLLEGADAARPLPEGITVRRVPDDLGYAELLETIFGADQVIAW